MPSGRKKIGASMQDIANALQISKVTVSKALRGEKGVSEAVRYQVEQKARELGYHMEERRISGKYAFLVSKRFFLETDSFYTKMYYEINKLCEKNNSTITLIVIRSVEEKNNLLPLQLTGGMYQGLIIAGEISPEYVKVVRDLGAPVVLLDFDVPDLSLPSVLTENFYWGMQVTEYLIRHGHTRIGFVGNPGDTESITDRYFGYRKALMMHNLAYRPEWTICNNRADTGIYTSAIELPDELPTAFVCHCDMGAYYLSMTLAAKGIRCPEDVSLIAFDNTELAAKMEPPLTSVNINLRSFAQLALEYLNKEGTRHYVQAGLIEHLSVKQI